MAEGIRHIDGAVRAHRHTIRIGQARRRARAVVRARQHGNAGKIGHIPRRRDFADGLVERVGDINGAVGIHGQAGRRIEAREATVAVVGAAEAGATRQRGDLSGRGDFADGMVGEVRDIDIGPGIHGHGGRETEESVGHVAVRAARPAERSRER